MDIRRELDWAGAVLLCSPDMVEKLPADLRAGAVVSASSPPGTVMLADSSLTKFTNCQITPGILPFNEDPYDSSLVPDGEEPVLMLSVHVDLSWDFRVQTNNWLIRTFGTRRKPGRFFRMRCYDTLPANPAAILKFGACA